MGAPIGNTNAEGNSGLPKRFETPELLQAAIDDYFNEGVTKRTVIIGKAPNQETIEIEVPTITGLCYYLGFESRQSFYDYEKYVEFSYTIKRARLFIEKEYEEQLQVGNTTGAIFALKNMGWMDSNQTTLTGKDGSPLFDNTFHFIMHDSGEPIASDETPTDTPE